MGRSRSPTRHNRALLEPAGFAEVEVEELPGSMSFTDFEDYWTLQSQVSGPNTLLIATLPPDDVAAVRRTMAPMLDDSRLRTDSRFPRSLWV